jgi:hypothetical protein
MEGRLLLCNGNIGPKYNAHICYIKKFEIIYS